MYDNEYFKEIMGNQYKESDLYANTYNKNNHNFVVLDPNDRVPSYEKINFGDLNSQLDDDDEKTLMANNRLNQKYALKSKNAGEPNINLENKIMSRLNDNSNINNAELVNTKQEETKDVAKNIGNEVKANFKKAENDIKEVEDKIKDDVSTASIDIKRDFDKYYPEIYRIINPMIETALSKNENITNDVLEKIVSEIYYAIDGYDGNKSILVSKNQNNSILYDLIKIVLLDKLDHKMNDINKNQDNYYEGLNNKSDDQTDNKLDYDNQDNNIKNASVNQKISYLEIPFPEDA